MIVTTPSTNLANSVSPFSNVGQTPVGQEGVETRNTTFQAVEETAETAATLNRYNPEARLSETEERQRLRDARQSAADPEDKKAEAKSDAEVKQLANDQQRIQELAARDREVRAHEQAHKSVGGQYAGAMSFTFVRGPDGVAYAVGGEVSISTSPVANDPEATIQKMQTIQRAALAPADPSPQDRRVAAQAVQQMVQARAELTIQNREEQTQEAERISEEESERGAESALAEEERLEAERRAEESRVDTSSQGSQGLKNQGEFEFVFTNNRADEQVDQSVLERFEDINRVSRNVSNRMIELGLTGSSAQGFSLGRAVDNFV